MTKLLEEERKQLVELRRQRSRTKWGEDFVKACRLAGLFRVREGWHK